MWPWTGLGICHLEHHPITKRQCSNCGTHLHLVVALQLLVLSIQTSVKLSLEFTNGVAHLALPELPVILVGILTNQSLQLLHLLLMQLEREIRSIKEWKTLTC